MWQPHCFVLCSGSSIRDRTTLGNARQIGEVSTANGQAHRRPVTLGMPCQPRTKAAGAPVLASPPYVCWRPDGRNRWRACKTAGVTPITRLFEGKDPLRAQQGVMHGASRRRNAGGYAFSPKVAAPALNSSKRWQSDAEHARDRLSACWLTLTVFDRPRPAPAPAA